MQMGGPGSGRKPKRAAGAVAKTMMQTPAATRERDAPDSGDEVEGEPFPWGTCVVVMHPHPLAASHGLVTHASYGSYGIRFLLRKTTSRYASVPTDFLSSDSLDVDVDKASVRACRAYLAIQLGPANQVAPIAFAPNMPVQFDGTSFQPSAWREAWALWESTWLRALVAPVHTTTPTAHDDDDGPVTYVVMWDAKQLTAEFSTDDVCIEDTTACNDRMRRERTLANKAFEPVSSDSSDSMVSSDPMVGASPLCIICGAAGAAGAAADEPSHSACTVREADKSSTVTTKHTTTTVAVDTPAHGGRTITTTETTKLTETTTTITKYITTTTKTTRTVVPVYPRGLVPALHALYDQCTRACAGALVVCSTCHLAVCVPCIVTHFPFEAHCDLIPLTRATSPYQWQCPRCDEHPQLGTPLPVNFGI
jgi:hypothetical protein